MTIFNLIHLIRRNKSAETAKNRLHILISQEKTEKNGPDYLHTLRCEILALIAKHTKADLDKVNVELHHKDKNAILELIVTLPDEVATTA